MFIGHYAAGLALKGYEKRASLGMLFIAVQFVDILFFPLMMAGIEKVRLIPNFTEVNSFDMYFYPYTHGLLSGILWAGLFYLVYLVIPSKSKPGRKSIALVMALGVLSHWFADLIVHTPDLPLLGDASQKVGFGLWNNAPATFILEAVLVISAMWYYLKKTTATSPGGKYAMYIFIGFMIVMNYVNMFVMPQGDDITEVSISALIAYFLFAGIAHLLDKKRA